MRMTMALVSTMAILLGAAAPAAAASFIPRPTEPIACPAGPAAGLWQGYFHGRKETESGWQKYEEAAESPCFRTEKLCRNWLYNMLSEYKYMVWSADCRPFGG